ncbi:pyridoxal-phosphate dependent enzyme [Nonomuraea sp. NPDC050310]|uniref:pyridoxal-phosphate dependent enzyme n=1 Tax=Nonomuraea sp. NPDC050310 TaxID=3154935 RepID=UPI0033EF9760
MTLPNYTCACGLSHEVVASRWRCDCGGLLELPEHELVWKPGGEGSMWRYAADIAGGALDWAALSLGEGRTPLVEERPGLFLKLEYVAPTGSFKDRGAVVLVALARLAGADRLVADSSGNAGTAVAAYAARAGIEAEIFVPAGTSEKKLTQVRGHGAQVTVVPGTREDTAAAAIERVEEGGAFYASHVYNPFFHEGTKTYAYELVEQLGRAPGTVVLPAGNGTLVLGAHRGFAELRAAGVIDRMPRVVAVQAERCAPLAGRTGFLPTVAEGIAIADPARREGILRAVDEVVTVTEAEIGAARAELARRGLWVEPTGAVAYAAAARARHYEGPVAAPLCGSGLKH